MSTAVPPVGVREWSLGPVKDNPLHFIAMELTRFQIQLQRRAIEVSVIPPSD